ncbi:hypothetical protein G6F31_016434 [Rhizopus arrhizus]|nr:hypothetical protein G6F31_016434 [Rhizopus arrhizus]
MGVFRPVRRVELPVQLAGVRPAAGIRYALAGAMGARHRARDLVIANNAEFVAVLGRPQVARIRDAIGALPRTLLPSDRTRGRIPAAHAVGLDLHPRRRRIEPGISHRKGAVQRIATAGNHTDAVLHLVNAKGAAVHLRHQQVVLQVAIVNRQAVQATPVAAGLHERQPHPSLPAQIRDAMHRAGA